MFKIPGKTIQVRLFDKVETEDGQYDVYDVGLQYDDGGIDSVAFGGSFYTLKKLIKQANDAAMTRNESDSTPAAAPAEPAVQGVVMHPVTKFDGAEQDIEGL